jgi:peptide/nickel transport system substrate-binding protein
MTQNTPNWNRDTAEGTRVLRDWEQEMVDIISAYCTESDMAQRAELLSQYNRIFTEHNYAVGVIIGRYGLALAERFQNVPGGTPTFLYQWVEDAVLSEQVWTPVEEQEPQVRPNTIPVYETE